MSAVEHLNNNSKRELYWKDKEKITLAPRVFLGENSPSWLCGFQKTSSPWRIQTGKSKLRNSLQSQGAIGCAPPALV